VNRPRSSQDLRHSACFAGRFLAASVSAPSHQPGSLVRDVRSPIPTTQIGHIRRWQTVLGGRGFQPLQSRRGIWPTTLRRGSLAFIAGIFQHHHPSTGSAVQSPAMGNIETLLRPFATPPCFCRLNPWLETDCGMAPAAHSLWSCSDPLAISGNQGYFKDKIKPSCGQRPRERFLQGRGLCRDS